jgi:hypothetical protein
MERQPANEPMVTEIQDHGAPSPLHRLKRSIEAWASQGLMPRAVDLASGSLYTVITTIDHKARA